MRGDVDSFPSEISLFLHVSLAHDKFFRGKGREWSEDLQVPAEDFDDSQQQSIKLEKKYSLETTNTINLLDERLIPFELILRLLECICTESRYFEYSAAILIFMPGIAEIRRLNDMLVDHPMFGLDNCFRIYPLHSTLSSESQSMVFQVPPSGIRKIVIGVFLPLFFLEKKNTS
jgi:ATP-dependent RNA helicase DHX29